MQGSVNNALCFVGPHRVYSQWSQTFYELTPGQGHFGPDALPGVRVSRRFSPTQPLVLVPSRVEKAKNLQLSLLCVPFGRMPAGVAARPSPWKRPATPWSASRRPRTRRWSSRGARRKRRRRTRVCVCQLALASVEKRQRRVGADHGAHKQCSGQERGCRYRYTGKNRPPKVCGAWCACVG